MIYKFIIITIIALNLVSCTNSISFYGVYRPVMANDGYTIHSFEYKSDLLNVDKYNPKAIFFYIQGSGCKSVLPSIEYLASAALFGGRVIVSEKRGVMNDSVNFDECFKFYKKEVIVQDHHNVIKSYLSEVSDSIPVFLIGASEGGDIASVIAARESRIDYLMLLSSGGGISQKSEFEEFINSQNGYLGLKNNKSLDSVVDIIWQSNDDSKLWAGLPYRRWKTFLLDSSLSYLKNLDIPILLIHGDKDLNVPVSSSRKINEYFLKNDKRNLTYREYNNMDHKFLDVNRNTSLYPLIEIDIIKWLRDYKLVSQDEFETFVARVKKNHKELFPD